MSQLGRIGGQVLTDNLLRAGVDLAFETDLLYLDVNNRQIGIRDSTPIYTVDVNSHLNTNTFTVVDQIRIDDILIASNTISSITSPIDVYTVSPIIAHDRLITSALEFDDNFISSFSNNDIVLNPNGSGIIQLQANTTVVGELSVSGNINVTGNLRSDGVVIVGDNAVDTVTIAPDLTQDLVPGDNNLYSLGSALKRWNTGYSNNVDLNTGFTAGNITIAAPSSISNAVGNISINISGSNPTANFSSAIQTSGIRVEGNSIQSVSSQNIRFNPNGAGVIRLEANTNALSDLTVSGNTAMVGNFTLLGTITIGNQTIDTVTISPDFTQSIIPGEDAVYALGADAGDSSPRRWSEVHSPQWQYISTGVWPGSGLRPQTAIVSEQLSLDGVNNKISTIQSNEDIRLLPDTGITRIEATRWQDNDITNLQNTAFTFGSTGNGYVRFMGDNALLLPVGTDLQRRASPEVGETRWNTDQDYLECYDGTVWAVSTGGGVEVDVPIMEDLSHVYTLMLG
jgi:hypothetical protein